MFHAKRVSRETNVTYETDKYLNEDRKEKVYRTVCYSQSRLR